MITETKDRITRSIQNIEEVFDDNQTRSYLLAIQLGFEGLSVSVLDDVLGRVLTLEQYVFQSVSSYDVLAKFIPQVMAQSSIMGYPYKKVNVAFVSPKSTLVPNSLFESGKEKKILEFNHSIDINEVICADSLMNLDSKNIFSMPVVLQKAFNDVYTNCAFSHYSSSLIEALLIANKNNPEKKVYVHVQNTCFEIIVVKGKELLFYNTFSYKTAEDFIYYVLFVCEQLQLNPENTTIELLGNIEKDTTLYKIVYKYIRNVKFGLRPETFNYGLKVGSLPRHNHFALFSQFVYSSGLF